MLLVEDEEGQREAVVQLIRIGYEQTQGYLAGSISGWEAAALPVKSFERIDVNTLYKRWSQHTQMAIVDVRRDDEWREGHIPDSLHLHLGELSQQLDEIPRDVPIAVTCRTGQRAAIGASIIAATGRQVIAVQGGVPDWTQRGLPTVTGEDAVPQTSEHEHVIHAHP